MSLRETKSTAAVRAHASRRNRYSNPCLGRSSPCSGGRIRGFFPVAIDEGAPRLQYGACELDT